MNWYYAKEGQQAGPIDDAELSRLVTSGAIAGSTLVWREGMAQWQPYQEVWTQGMPDWRTGGAAATPPGLATSSPTPTGIQPTQGPACTVCKKAFAGDDLVLIEGQMVCAICKPTLLQRLKEGGFAGTLDNLSPDALAQASQARNRSLNAMECLEKSWAFFKKEPGLALATVIVAYVVMFVGGVIPLLNWLIGFAINGPLMAGMWLVFIRSLRGESMSVGDVFKGFSTAWMPLVLVNFLTTVLVILAFLPGFIPMIFFAITGRLQNNMNPGEVALVAGGVLLFLPAVIYLSLAWIFALPLVIDRNFGAWEAMMTSMRVVNRNLGPLLLLGLLCLACYILGMLALCVGVLVAGPVIMGALAAAYEELLGSGVNRR